jgi:phosphatidylglycerol lysyltransferase
MTERMRHTAGAVVGLLLFALALGLLTHELRQYHWADVAAALRALPPARVAAAALLTAFNYFALTGYDVLALHVVGRVLPYRRTAFASFVSYVVSHNVGASFLGGAAMRLHLYSGWGLAAREVAGVIALNAVTFWLGVLVLLGAALLVSPSSTTLTWSIPAGGAWLVGVACLATVGAYLLVAARGAPRLGWRRWRIPTPPFRMALAQVAVSTADWLLAAAVLWVLLPGGLVAFPQFVAVFLLAQVAGVVSHVPAGLGVFEVVMLHLVPHGTDGAAVIAALVAYRLVYYLLPLATAAGLLAGRELGRRRAGVSRAADVVGRWLPLPQILAATCFIAGVVLLASGATPAAAGRLGLLADVLPLSVVEVSHFAGSVVGAALLVLARGLQRRLDGAWAVTVALLVAGIVASLLKGFDYEEAILLALVLAALLPCRRQFFRRASLLDEPFTAEWITAILLVVVGVGWLLLFSYKHVEYTRDLWWQFELSAEAPRSLRASVGAMLLLLLVGGWRLLRPAPPSLAKPTADDLERVAAIAGSSRRATAWLAFLGDKRFVFDDGRRGFVMYGIEGRSWIALGDPVGPPEVVRALAWRFRELSDRHGGWTVFYEVGAEQLPLYLDMGLDLRKLGEEARVPLPTFSLDGGARKSLRTIYRRAQRDGLSVDVVMPPGVGALLPELQAISDAWLAHKHTREKGFSLGFFSPEYLARLPVAVARRDGAVIAFANLLPGAEHEELTCDLMRYRPGAYPSLMEFLFVELFLWGRAEGYRWFNLGMAPFSGLESHALAPLWNRIGGLLFRHGEDFYNFQGLRRFKDKFDPVWEPRYLASPGGVVLPRVLANVAALISGGMKGVIAR